MTGEIESELMPAVKRLHRLAEKWQRELEATGDFDEADFLAMAETRQGMYERTPSTPLDALFVLGAIRAVASFGFQALSGNKRLTKAERTFALEALAEILIGLSCLRRKLENESGFTLKGLGLFTDGAARQ